MCIKLLKPPKKNYHKRKICVFQYVRKDFAALHVSKRPSVKLDHYSLYDGQSSSHFHVKIRLKISCLNGHEPSMFRCSVKHAIKSHVIVAIITGY